MERFQPNGIGNKFRAIMAMTFLEMWTLFSIYNYWDVIFKQRNTIQLFLFNWLPFVGVFLIKWFAFIKDDRWKDYVQKFDRWNSEINERGTLFVLVAVVIVISNCVISTCLL